MMGQGYTPDPGPAYRSSSGVGMPPAEESFLSQVQAWSAKAEDIIEAYTQVSSVPHRRIVWSMA